VNAALLFASLCLVVGGLLLCEHVLSRRRVALSVRLARARGGEPALQGTVEASIPESVREWSEGVRVGYAQELRKAGKSETVARLLAKKALFAFAMPWCPLVVYAAAAGRLPSAVVLLVLAVFGFSLPDLALRMEAKQRREALLMDLPDALAVMALSLGAGQSLRRALGLAAQDCQGPLGEELTRALSLAHRDKTISEREALVVVAHETGEEGFTRFAELLAAKESPYLAFLRTQAKTLRADQDRHLERAADSAYRRMQLWIAPLAGVMLLILAYGFLHLLANST
jgi:Flp pilus assembly protein TadB